jgi:hypothetical protein
MKKYTALIVPIAFALLLAACAANPGGTSPVGTIIAPPSTPNPRDPVDFTAGLIRNGISLLITVAFIVDFFWTILAGIRLITSSGDPKAVSATWSQIYMGLIGMLVVVGSYAIIVLIETFFGIPIISGGFLPGI